MIDRDLCGVKPDTLLRLFDKGHDTARMCLIFAQRNRALGAPTEAAIANALTRALDQRQDLLRRVREAGDHRNCVLSLGGSASSVTYCLNALCVRRAIRMPPWTGRETALLRQMWPTSLTPREIADNLGRTRAAVIGKADRLNLPTKLPRKRARAA